MKKGKISDAKDAIKRIEAGTYNAILPKGVEGYSGKKLIATLHALTELFCNNSNAYLELGVFRGLTLLSNAFANPSVPCYGIDNFSLFDERGKNLSTIKAHVKRLTLKNVNIINRDFDDALDTLEKYIGKKKVGVFFVDGPHDYRSQLVPLLKIVPYMAEECAIVIDDANYPHVRQATNDFLRSHPDFALLLEAYTPKHVANMNDKEKKDAMAGWWNGVNVIVRDPKGTIRRSFVKEQNRNLYFASHDVFRHEFAEIAFDVMKLVQSLADSKPSGEAEILEQLKQLIHEYRKKNPARFRHQNTYSSELPKFKLHD